MDKKSLILEFMKSENYVPMKKKELAQVLLVPHEEYSELEKVLNELEQEYKIRKNHKNRYIVMDDLYIEGTYRRNAKGFGFVSVNEDFEIYIKNTNSMGALNGDYVLVKQLDKKEGEHNEGKIIKIIKREIKEVVGTFQKSKNFGFVVPNNSQIGTDIYISKKNCNNAKNNDKVVAKIIKYPNLNKKAEGEIIEIIGKTDEAGVDMMCLIKEYSLPYEFPKFVLDEANLINDEIDKNDIF